MKPNNVIELTAQLANPAWKWLLATLAAGVSFVLPEQLQKDMAVAAAVLIGLDTATGFIAALSTGQPISSARFSRVLAKLVGYGSVVIVAAVAGKFLANGSPVGEATQVGVLTLVLTTEGISILENVRKMGLKFPSPLEKMLGGQDRPEAEKETAP